MGEIDTLLWLDGYPFPDVVRRAHLTSACEGCGHAPHAVGLCEADTHPACDCNDDDTSTSR